MYQNILVPISLDGDRDVARSVEVAQALKSDGGHITFLHVIEHLPQYTNDLLPEDHLERVKTVASEKLRALMNGVMNTRIVIVEGHAGRGILDYAASHDVDCIVIANHQPGLQDYLLGSTAARVVRHAHSAVHVIR
ncbi:universal stress protein [Ruegeria sp. Ofav3-42]|uniref:universal stress protein n=1 Tax=Ruegeria sp. Ofav3-42 TaxID=2917759 RepID=UPI001EF5C269|nr:universal stress protein [Ruegeria sp. Ofav3-42]MCG7522604.1 universal stress protein [Ruegeria sp. Ofav3-42]